MTSAKSILATSLGLGAIALLQVGGCGAKTGLPIPDPNGSNRDGAADARDSGPACGTFAIVDEPAALEVFIAMDTSGSMQDLTSQGTQKLDAVKSALSQFVLNPNSAGIGVTIAFFPKTHPEVPELCAADSSCGAKDACKPFSVCFPSFQACAISADCAAGETCEPVGFCGGVVQDYCLPGSFPCAGGQFCQPGGWCENRTVCDSPSYEPSVEPAQLPDGAGAILDLLNQQLADGGTPTLPALAGAISAARARQQQLPYIKPIVLLATDGFPTLCDPAIQTPFKQTSDGIPGVAAAAAEGHQGGVQTFVIGVFAPDEAGIAQLNLDAIASAGGTNSAYVITTNQAVTEKLVATLNEIRNSAAACDYVLPQPGGVPLDAKNLKLTLTTSKGSHLLTRRTSLHACDPEEGGFVFDKDPFGSDPPTRIQLCPASCAELDADPGGLLEATVDCDAG